MTNGIRNGAQASPPAPRDGLGEARGRAAASTAEGPMYRIAMIVVMGGLLLGASRCNKDEPKNDDGDQPTEGGGVSGAGGSSAGGSAGSGSHDPGGGGSGKGGGPISGGSGGSSSGSGGNGGNAGS